jgi:hypothetical protein
VERDVRRDGRHRRLTIALYVTVTNNVLILTAVLGFVVMIATVDGYPPDGWIAFHTVLLVLVTVATAVSHRLLPSPTGRRSWLLGPAIVLACEQTGRHSHWWLFAWRGFGVATVIGVVVVFVLLVSRMSFLFA